MLRSSLIPMGTAIGNHLAHKRKRCRQFPPRCQGNTSEQSLAKRAIAEILHPTIEVAYPGRDGRVLLQTRGLEEIHLRNTPFQGYEFQVKPLHIVCEEAIGHEVCSRFCLLALSFSHCW